MIRKEVEREPSSEEPQVFIPQDITVLWQKLQLVMTAAFYIDRNAVSYREYLEYLLDTGKFIEKPMWKISGLFRKKVEPRFATLDDPVTNVRWEEAEQYAKWRGARLPQAIEWLRAMRGTKNGNFLGGTETDVNRYLEDFANHELNGFIEKKPWEILREHASPFDTGETLNPVISPTPLYEWTKLPDLHSVSHALNIKLLDHKRNGEVAKAKRLNDQRLIPAIYHHYDQIQQSIRKQLLDQSNSEERPLMAFVPGYGSLEIGMTSSLKKHWRGGKICFRCARDA